MASSIRYGFIVLAAFLYCVQVTAAPIVRPASSSDVFIKGGERLNIDNHWGEILDVPFSSGSKSVSVDVKQTRGFGWGRVGGWVKNGIKSHPGKLLATAGVMYLIDQLPGASYDPLTGQPVIAPETNTIVTFWTPSFGTSGRYASAIDACRQGVSSTRYVTKEGGTAPISDSDTMAACRVANGQYLGPVYKGTEACLHGHTGLECNSSPPSNRPLTDAEYDQLVLKVPDIPQSLWDSLGPELSSIPGTFEGPDIEDFTGPSSIELPSITTTTTDHVTGDTTVSESIPSVSFEYATSPLNITATPSITTNTYTNGNLTNTSTTTAPSVSPVAGGGGGGGGDATIEVPTDCDFMPTVCAFIDWVKTPFEPEEVDFAELIEDDDFTRSVTFSGSAVCPSPTVISTDLGEFEFSWQPACTWAEMLKPLLLIAALLSAIYITLGIGRAD